MAQPSTVTMPIDNEYDDLPIKPVAQSPPLEQQVEPARMEEPAIGATADLDGGNGKCPFDPTRPISDWTEAGLEWWLASPDRPIDLEMLLRAAGPYFEYPPDRDEEIFDRLDLFGQLIHRLTSATQKQHARQLWVDWLGKEAVPPLKQPWRTVDVAIEAGAGEAKGESTRTFRWIEDTELEQLSRALELVAGHINEGSTVVLYGPPGSGKTFIALDIAFCVGTGQPWFSNEVRKGRVAYILAEGKGGAANRVQAWKAAYFNPDEPANVSFLPQPVEFLHPEDVSSLLSDLEAWDPPPKLVVIDTLAQCLVGGDENSAKDMGLFIHATNQLRQELGCAVLVVHHTGWDSKHERGSTALRGATDTTIRAEREGDEITVTCEKQKESQPFDRLRLKLRPEVESCVLTLAVHDPDRLGSKDIASLQALDEIAMENGATASQWLKAAIQPSDSLSNSRESKRVELSEGTFWRILKTLTNGEYVECRLKRYHITTKGHTTLNSQTTLKQLS